MTTYEKSRYDRLPAAMREPARAYVEDHQPVGGFLTAVLSNSLVDAFGRADDENRMFMAEWALWLWNDIPGKCWGSPEKVEAWLDEERGYDCAYCPLGGVGEPVLLDGHPAHPDCADACHGMSPGQLAEVRTAVLAAVV